MSRKFHYAPHLVSLSHYKTHNIKLYNIQLHLFIKFIAFLSEKDRKLFFF